MRPDRSVDPNADLDARGQAEIEGRAGPAAPALDGGGEPPAGPHGVPGLTDPAATPGTGALPGAGTDDEADAATC